MMKDLKSLFSEAEYQKQYKLTTEYFFTDDYPVFFENVEAIRYKSVPFMFVIINWFVVVILHKSASLLR